MNTASARPIWARLKLNPNAFDERLVYYKEQWAVLHHYCTPQDANWERAEDLLFNDVLNIVTGLLENDTEDEEPGDEE